MGWKKKPSFIQQRAIPTIEDNIAINVTEVQESEIANEKYVTKIEKSKANLVHQTCLPLLVSSLSTQEHEIPLKNIAPKEGYAQIGEINSKYPIMVTNEEVQSPVDEITLPY